MLYEPAGEPVFDSAKEAAHELDERSMHGRFESESLLCDATAVPTALQAPMEQPAVDRAGERAASLAGPGDSRPEPLLSDGNAAGAALQPDLPDAETQADPRALPFALVPLASTWDRLATPLVGPGSGDDPGEAPELQPDSPGASQPRTLSSDGHVAGGNAAVQEA